MSKKTKQTVTMIVLCVLLIGAGIGYYALIRHQSAQQEAEKQKEESEEIVIYTLEESEVQRISYKTQKADMSLVKKKKRWENEKDASFPLNQEKAGFMLDEVASLTADRLVAENCDDLAQYELEEPVLQIQVETSDGEQHVIAVGKESMDGGGRYGYCDDSSKVYILPTTIFSNFDYTNNQMMEVAEIPDITSDYVTHLAIDSRKGEDFEATYDEKDSPFQDIYSWTIEKPYQHAVAGDVDQLTTLFDGFSKLSFSECADYKCKEGQLKKYGLDQPNYQIRLDYYEVEGEEDEEDGSVESTEESDQKEKKKIYKKLSLMIGKKNKDKTGYYVRMAGDKAVYLMDTGTVEAMVKITPLSYVYSKFYVANEEKLQSIQLKYQGKDYHMTLERKKKDDEDTSEEYSYTAKINGKKVDEESFRSAYEACGEWMIHGEIDKSVTPQGKKAIATIQFQEKNKEVTIRIYPYDGNNFYRVEVDGVMQFVTDMRNVDSVLESFVSLTK